MIPQAGLPTPLHRTAWQTARFKFLFEKRNRPVREDDGVVTAFRDGVVTLRSNRREDGFTFADKEIGYQGVEPGDLVIHAMDGFAGAIGISDSRGKCSPVYSMATPRAGVPAEPRFWAYYLRNLATTGFIHSLAKGIRERSTDFRWRDAGNLLVNFPDLETQKAIADFLDRETARIDQLIEKKQRLVELLVNREKNLIGECLARGIDPNAEFQSVKQEWLGRIPSHWRVVPLKGLIWYQEGPGIMADDFREEGIPLLRIKGLSGQHATLEGCNYLDPEKVQKRWGHFRVELGDFLISASATRGGIASLVTEEVVGAIPYTGIIRIKPRAKGYVSEIIPYFLLSSLFDTQIDLLSAGSTIQHFGPTHLGRMKAPLPPQDEQRNIARFLGDRVPLIRQAREQTEGSQSKLKEFRAAFITAAVTGQIDVAAWRNGGRVQRQIEDLESQLQRKGALA
ncbi:MAG: restriction endonuclease subunit S [Caulobacterales bacterium]